MTVDTNPLNVLESSGTQYLSAPRDKCIHIGLPQRAVAHDCREYVGKGHNCKELAAGSLAHLRQLAAIFEDESATAEAQSNCHRRQNQLD